MFKMFKSFSSKIAESTKKLFEKIGGIFGKKNLDDASIEDIEEILYQADFGVKTTESILESVKNLYRKDKKIRHKDVIEITSGVIKNSLEGAEGSLNISGDDITVITLVGTNGAGKTTTAAKLAKFLQSRGNSVLLGACDTFRAAANEQINIWAERLGIDIVSSQHGADSAAVAYDAYCAAISRKHNVLILDTAGRLHTKTNLMGELDKINRTLKKLNADVVNNVWLVVDGSIGANSIEAAKAFNSSIGLHGVIVTKLDGTSRGGALVGIYQELKIPVYFIGLGEQQDDLKQFSISEYISAIVE